MAISIDWVAKVISVPKADLQLIQSTPTEIRQLSIDAFRLELKSLESDETGIVYPITHVHVAPIDVGGVQLARVVELINDYTVTFEDGQYAVNLSGANSNIGDRVNVNQVSVRSANSAGLTYSKEVEDQSFTDSRVFVDTISGLPGTDFPRGTPGSPVDNLVDAQSIIEQRNLPRRIKFVRGSIVAPPPTDLSGYDIEGSSARQCSLDVDVGVDTTDMVLSKLSITGDINGAVDATNSTSLVDLMDFDGRLDSCGLDGTVSLGQVPGSIHEFIDCFSEVPGTGFPTLDCKDHDDLFIFFRRYSGSLNITNYSGASNQMTVDMDSGRVILDSTCTAGTIVVRGVGECIDNSGPGCTVITTGLVSGEDVGLTPAQDQLLADIASKTDQLTFSKAGEVDSNIKSVNDTEVTGSGTAQDPWGP